MIADSRCNFLEAVPELFFLHLLQILSQENLFLLNEEVSVEGKANIEC